MGGVGRGRGGVWGGGWSGGGRPVQRRGAGDEVCATGRVVCCLAGFCGVLGRIAACCGARRVSAVFHLVSVSDVRMCTFADAGGFTLARFGICVGVGVGVTLVSLFLILLILLVGHTHVLRFTSQQPVSQAFGAAALSRDCPVRSIRQKQQQQQWLSGLLVLLPVNGWNFGRVAGAMGSGVAGLARPGGERRALRPSVDLQ